MNHTVENSILMPTTYLGPIEYFYYLNQFKQVTVEQQETWQKQTYRNRTLIVTDKGTIPLSIPVVRINGNHTKTADIEISYREKWYIKHWRAIQSAYQNSPYFLYYSDDIKEVLFSQEANLLKLNEQLTKLICELMEIDVSLMFTESFSKPVDNNKFDIRYKISPKLPSTIKYFPEYTQVFSDKQPFIPNASILDLLFCLGPESKGYLDKLQ